MSRSAMAVESCCWGLSLVSVLLLAPSLRSNPGVSGERVALVEVFLRDLPGTPRPGYRLQGAVLEKTPAASDSKGLEQNQQLAEGSLILVEDEEQEQDSPVKREAAEPWIGLVPVEVEQAEAQRGSQETFAAAVVSKMKRALVLGASALLILALNQNTIREMDLSQVLSKPVVVIQTSENVTKLIGALLRGLRATAKITYKSILQDNLSNKRYHISFSLSIIFGLIRLPFHLSATEKYEILKPDVTNHAVWRLIQHETARPGEVVRLDYQGATLTLWSSCGRSRSGLYGEWQGVICTGETNSQVQKYLQQLWNTILLVALILCTGVVVQARWQYRHYQSNEDMELHPKHDIVKHLAALKTRQYHPLGAQEQGGETENCAVCLEQFHKKQCLRVLPCLHEFHRDCVDPWLLLQQTCPLCKRSILGNYSTAS